MKASQKCWTLLFLLLMGGFVFAEAGRGGHRGERPGPNRQGSHRDRFPTHRDREYAYNSRSRRGDSRGRRRRKASKSRSSSAGKRTAKDEKPSPGYLEYKQAKIEAASQHERRLQAQAIAAVLDERELQRQAAAAASMAAHPQMPPLPGNQARSPGEALWNHAPQMPPPQEQIQAVSAGAVRLLQAELHHKVDLGTDPLTVEALAEKLSQCKGLGKQMDAVISRYSKDGKAPPARVAAKAKVLASLASTFNF
ncbi:unnamed protein product [Symbiodinium necroappetens]|uniref:Uncharacterized protein n=1 Tax=Symbiodinium necroappetens TaxID=1628268 RepID=A0A813AIT5_9DINO|nr:unnamed protein product [Symbiodinium necroappetens]